MSLTEIFKNYKFVAYDTGCAALVTSPVILAGIVLGIGMIILMGGMA